MATQKEIDRIIETKRRGRAPRFLKRRKLSLDRRRYIADLRKSLGAKAARKVLAEEVQKTYFERRRNVENLLARRRYGVDFNDLPYDYKNRTRRRISQNAYRIARQRTVASGGRVFAAVVSEKVKASEFRVSAMPWSENAPFGEAMRQWPLLVMARFDALLTGIVDFAFENIVARTPVLTGKARQGWFKQQTGPYSYLIGNNEPHIRRLEHGWSRQPNRWMMVRATHKRLPQIVHQAAEELAAG